VLQRLAEDFPEFVPAANVLEAGLQGPGMLVHPLPMLMNAVRIDREAPLTYNSYDITPSVARAMEALDRERMAVVEALGGTVKPIQAILTDYYGVTGDGFLDTVLKVPAYQNASAPTDFRHRYISEEVPTNLVPAAALGRLLGIETPVMDATISLSSAVAGANHAKDGWTLERLGLSHVTAASLPSLLESGIMH
jgi:opine dehydrogenase